MREREPFVSGLAGAVSSDPDPVGSALLQMIDAIARDDAELLESLCVNRFDGVDIHHADPLAIEKRRGYLGIVRLVEWVQADAGRKRAAAAALSKVSGEVMGGGMPRDRYPSARR